MSRPYAIRVKKHVLLELVSRDIKEVYTCSYTNYKEAYVSYYIIVRYRDHYLLMFVVLATPLSPGIETYMYYLEHYEPLCNTSCPV